MVKELAACQDAITERMRPTHPGYLGALPEDTVLRLGPPRWAVYGSNLTTNTWAPWSVLSELPMITADIN